MSMRKTFVGSRRRITTAWHDTAAITGIDRLDDICVCNGVLYAMGLRTVLNYQYPWVWSYDPVGNTWTSCGNSYTNYGIMFSPGRLVSLDNRLYALNTCIYLTKYCWVTRYEGGTSWLNRGSFWSGGSAVVLSPFAENGTYLWGAQRADYKNKVYRWTSPTTWTLSGHGDTGSGECDDDYLYRHGSLLISMTKYSTRANNRIAQWAGDTNWTDMGKPTHVTAGDNCGGASDGSIFYCGSIPGSAAHPEIFKWTSGTTWTACGSLSFNGAVPYRGMFFHNSELYACSTSGYVEKFTAPTTWTPVGAQPNGANTVFSGVSFNSCPYVAVEIKVCYYG